MPLFRTAGIALNYSFSEANTGDCVSFAPPDPVRPGDPRQRDPGPQVPAGPSPEELAQILLDRAISLAERPGLELAPHGIGLTGLPSYFWLANQPRPIEAIATAGPLTVTAEAGPRHYVWSFGDGEELTTSHPGRPWSPAHAGDIEHTYETSDSYEVSVTVVWQARWRVNSGPWMELGYFTTSDARDYPVRQLISVLTRSRR